MSSIAAASCSNFHVPAHHESHSLVVKLLVVEDEPRLLRSLSEALREEGYAVDIAADGVEGLYKAENTAYDAIVLDVMLPGMDGWEILRRMRRKQRTPVLMLTARVASAAPRTIAPRSRFAATPLRRCES